MFLVLIVCQDLFLIALPVVVQFQLYMNIACRSTELLRVSNEYLYGVLEVKCKGKYKFGAW